MLKWSFYFASEGQWRHYDFNTQISLKFCKLEAITLYGSEIEKNTGATEGNFELELSELVRFLETIDCECRMRDVISILCFSKK